MSPTEKQIEAAAKAMEPDLFSEDIDVAHRAASPLYIAVARSAVLKKCRAALSAAEAQEVKPRIKPLVWAYNAAETPVGWYVVSDVAVCLNDKILRIGPVTSMEAAKSAAQADYERRILSALEVSS